MNLWNRFRSWHHAILHRHSAERDMDAELRFHIDACAEDLVCTSVPRDEALRRARLQFGGLERAKEECRDATGANFFDSLVQDIRFALRQLRKSTGFAAVTVLTLALGIGANTAIFTVINAVMLRALPVQHPEQLVVIGNPARVHSFSTGTPRIDVFSYPLYREVQNNNSVLSSLLGSSHLENLRITIESGTENISGRLVTGNFFQTLGVQPLLGRTFTAEEDLVPGSDPFVVIAYGYWQRRFAGDPAVIGRKVRLNNCPFTIIGVAPPGFFGEVVGDRPDLWAPMMMQPQLMSSRNFLENANVASLLLIGRLKSGVTTEQARANVNAVVEQALRFTLDAKLSSDDRDAIRRMRIAVPVSSGRHGLSRLRQEFATPLLLLLAMVLLVLLVACVNVANLMLARSATRQREIAVRFAMGARPVRIFRQLLTESLVLAVLGGALGLVLAHWGAALLVSLASANSATGSPVSLQLDWRVLGFTTAVCLSAGVLFGLAPALRVLRVQLNKSLKQAGRHFEVGPKSGLRYILTASQIALGVLVLMAASLLVRSLQNLEETNLGYSRDQLLLVPIDLFASGYKGPAIQNATQELLLQFARLPGARSVTASYNGLFSGSESADTIKIDGASSEDQKDNVVTDDGIGPNYFGTIGAPVVLGREITQQDFSTAARVAVVNETFTKFYFKDRNPLGHKISIEDSDHPDRPPYEIVGVARDVHDHGVRDVVPRRMYAPITSATFDDSDTINFEIRAVGNPKMLIKSVRSAIRTLNPDLVVGDIETAGELVNDTLTSQVVVAKLSTCFGVLVLVLVCVGLYGSMSYNVASRTKEIGLRMALGAPRGNLVWMVMRETWLVLIIGLAVGIPVGIAASHLFKALLFGVSKSDPFSIAAAILALLAISVTAAIIPIRRATHVDPMVSLRHE
jgi:putative ABC transport system permease protein